MPAGAISVAVGDFNGDGKLDLALPGTLSVSILLGNGDGTFQPAVSYPAGITPSSIAVGDFNRDGKLDLAVANDGIPCCSGPPGSVWILLGNGDGSFRSGPHYAAGTDPLSIGTADFNHDGNLDLAVGTEFSGVEILLGNGDGTFQPAVGYNLDIYANSLAIADFNNDGNVDLAVAGTVGLAILLGNGNGTFQPAVTYGAGIMPNSVAVADFNRDGKLDLAVANTAVNGNLAILLGNGDGTFQPAVSYQLGEGASAVVTGDFNRDDKPDVAVTAGNGLTILVGTGKGTFIEPASYSLPGSPGSTASGDFNLDGSLDLAVATSNGVAVLLNKGHGAFRNAVNYPVGGPVAFVLVADFNSDGNPDIAAILGSGGGIVVLLGNGDGTFGKPVTSNVGFTFAGAGVADFNHDGALDLAVLATTGLDAPGVTIVLGNGDGTFQYPYPSVPYYAGPNPTALTVADVNGDGNADVLVVNYDQPPDDMGPGLVAVLLGNTNGTLGLAVQYEVQNGATSLVVGDFNGDGIPDLAVAQTAVYGEQSAISILLGYGEGFFLPPVNYTVGTGALALVAGDFDGEGKLDLILTLSYTPAPTSNNTASVMRGKGDGTFVLQTSGFEVGPAPDSVVAGDFRGDGKLDLAIAKYDSNAVTVLLNATH